MAEGTSKAEAAPAAQRPHGHPMQPHAPAPPSAQRGWALASDPEPSPPPHNSPAPGASAARWRDAGLGAAGIVLLWLLLSVLASPHAGYLLGAPLLGPLIALSLAGPIAFVCNLYGRPILSAGVLAPVLPLWMMSPSLLEWLA
jgi:hypothetical protein